MNLAGFAVGAREPLFLIAGPCVIESEALVLSTAERLKVVAAKLAIPFVFKASFDKANRSSLGGFRGLGFEQGLRILEVLVQHVLDVLWREAHLVPSIAILP